MGSPDRRMSRQQMIRQGTAIDTTWICINCDLNQENFCTRMRTCWCCPWNGTFFWCYDTDKTALYMFALSYFLQQGVLKRHNNCFNVMSRGTKSSPISNPWMLLFGKDSEIQQNRTCKILLSSFLHIYTWVQIVLYWLKIVWIQDWL